jgi:hypothetical protein
MIYTVYELKLIGETNLNVADIAPEDVLDKAFGHAAGKHGHYLIHQHTKTPINTFVRLRPHTETVVEHGDQPFR